MKKRRFLPAAVMAAVFTAAAACGLGLGGMAVPAQELSAGDMTTDIVNTGEHEPITWDLIRMVEHDAQLKCLLEKSIAQAAAMNPDRQSNPVDSLESYYEFIDWSIKAMPWEISPSTEYVSLYGRIDQSMG